MTYTRPALVAFLGGKYKCYGGLTPARSLISPRPSLPLPSPIHPRLRNSRSFPGCPSTSATQEMALIRRQSADSENIDDQGPLLWGTYSDDWSWDIGGSEYYNGTYTDTSVPGASFSFTFSGMQAVYAWPCSVALTYQDGNQGFKRGSTAPQPPPTQA